MPQEAAVKDDTAPGGDVPETVVPSAAVPGAVEAVLLTLDRPIAASRLAEALGLGVPEPAEPRAGEEPRRRRVGPGREAPAGGVRVVEEAIASLNAAYEATGRSFRIQAVAGGYRLMTLPAFAGAIAAVHKARAGGKLTRAALETLAIVAYKQPITRLHLEAIRGVSCGEVLRSLLERRLVEIKGRAEELGRPLLYGTGRPFLDAFGLASIKDLPTATELQINP